MLSNFCLFFIFRAGYDENKNEYQLYSYFLPFIK
jgi:hypothetical protein